MKYCTLFLLLFLPLYALQDDLPEINDVADLVWKNRIILIWSDAPKELKQTLQKSNSEIEDRDIVWFIINGEKISSNYKGKIANSFSANTTSKYSKISDKVLLIGKDGGIKNKSDELELDALFRKIDTMPMRINEMNAR